MHLFISLVVLSLELIVVFSLLGYILLMWLVLYPFHKMTAPFIPVRSKVLEKIVETLQLKKGSVVYDLGCGDARVLLVCYKQQPSAQYIGLDKKIFPYLLAKFLIRKLPKPQEIERAIEIYRQNFFTTDLRNATHIFAYLTPTVMNALESKFDRELQPGTRLVSCVFALPKRRPIQVVQVTSEVNQSCKTLYVYQY